MWGEDRTYTAHDLFMATGVRANTEGIDLKEVGVVTDESGAAIVDDELRTENP